VKCEKNAKGQYRQNEKTAQTYHEAEKPTHGGGQLGKKAIKGSTEEGKRSMTNFHLVPSSVKVDLAEFGVPHHCQAGKGEKPFWKGGNTL